MVDSIAQKFFNRNLTREEKIEIVKGHKDQYGLNRVLKMAGLAKSTWYYAQEKKIYEEKYSYLREPLMQIAEQHPEYGYRRSTSELHDRGLWINHKVIEKLHQLWYLSIGKKIKPPKPNPIREILKKAGSVINLVSRMKKIDDLEVLYTDFTEIIYKKGKARA